MLGLMAAGETGPAVARGAEYLARTQRRGRRVGGAGLYRGRFPARVLPALPRLPAVLPAASRWRGSATCSAATADGWRSVFDGARHRRRPRGRGAHRAPPRRAGRDRRRRARRAPAAAAARLIGARARAACSVSALAGGLDPALAPGALIVPDVILSADGHWPTAPAARGQRSAGSAARCSAAARCSRRRRRSARCSSAPAPPRSIWKAPRWPRRRRATRSRSPRCAPICDPAARSLPRAALAALDGDGRIAPRRVARDRARPSAASWPRCWRWPPTRRARGARCATDQRNRRA